MHMKVTLHRSRGISLSACHWVVTLGSLKGYESGNQGIQLCFDGRGVVNRSFPPYIYAMTHYNE